jgi:uncharacterized BrkB/YihY/UPF0761 family membrane protein
MTIPEQAGKVATSAIDAFKAQPGLLFLTLVNVAFLIFTYMLGQIVLTAYEEQQNQIHERYIAAIRVIDRCINEAFDHQPPPVTPTERMHGPP